MKYLSSVHGEQEVEELTKERVRFLLGNVYIPECVADIMDNDKQFRLRTPVRTIWTQTDDGLVPIPGFLGIVGE